VPRGIPSLLLEVDQDLVRLLVVSRDPDHYQALVILLAVSRRFWAESGQGPAVEETATFGVDVVGDMVFSLAECPYHSSIYG
jgi:hypothetical protein